MKKTRENLVEGMLYQSGSKFLFNKYIIHSNTNLPIASRPLPTNNSFDHYLKITTITIANKNQIDQKLIKDHVASLFIHQHSLFMFFSTLHV